MRIEKISDTQLKFTLRQPDLEERDIKISELSHTSDKTQRLFKEIIRLAQDEGAFPSESTPYLIEAMRLGVDSLAVVVTKINAEDLEKRYNLVPAAKERCYQKRNAPSSQEECSSQSSYSIFSFEDLDMSAIAAEAINSIFFGESRLYKISGTFFLWLLNEIEENKSTMEAILAEFGQMHVSNTLSLQYLDEYGEKIIPEDAVGKLNLYYGRTLSCTHQTITAKQ